MKLKGTLKTWKSDKGFGFITPSTGGNDVFVHISSFQNKSREPKIGDILIYEVDKEENGKVRAAAVSYSGEARREAAKGSSEKGLKIASAFSLSFICFLLALFVLNLVQGVVVTIYIVSSIIAFFMYWSDKSAARKGRWRTKESSLLMWGLIGGWPGALVAQQLFRHKSAKLEFQASFWASVVANSGLLAWLTTPAGNDFVSSLVSSTFG